MNPKLCHSLQGLSPAKGGPLPGKLVLGAISIAVLHRYLFPGTHPSQFLRLSSGLTSSTLLGFAASGEMTCPGLFQHPQDTFTLDKLQEKEQKILPVPEISTNINNILRNSKSSQAGHVRGALFSHTYRCGNVNEEGVAIYTHYLQE